MPLRVARLVLSGEHSAFDRLPFTEKHEPEANRSRASYRVVVGTTRPYAHVWLGGRAVDVKDDADLSNLDELSQIYFGEPFPDRTLTPVAVIAEIDRWYSYGLPQPDGDTK
ncbi:MAG TPA: hypothetical protein VGK33_11170 [Chloroflexota bacterium]